MRSSSIFSERVNAMLGLLGREVADDSNGREIFEALAVGILSIAKWIREARKSDPVFAFR